MAKSISSRLGARLTFIREKRSKSYKWYGDVSITAKKVDIALKSFRSTRLELVARKVGL